MAALYDGTVTPSSHLKESRRRALCTSWGAGSRELCRLGVLGEKSPLSHKQLGEKCSRCAVDPLTRSVTTRMLFKV